MLLKFTVVGSGIARGCYRGSGLWVVAVVLVVRLMVVARVVSMTPVCMMVVVVVVIAVVVECWQKTGEPRGVGEGVL